MYLNYILGEQFLVIVEDWEPSRLRGEVCLAELHEVWLGIRRFLLRDCLVCHVVWVRNYVNTSMWNVVDVPVLQSLVLFRAEACMEERCI